MSRACPEVSESNRRRAAARATERLAKPVVDGSLVAAAKDDRGTGRPLAVESLEEKLARHLPGAWVVDTGARSDERFAVHQRGAYSERVVGVGASRREAIAKAIFLFGAR